MADLLLSVGMPIDSVPESYIRPASQRPNFADVVIDGDIPIVDLGSNDESLIAAQVGQACQSYGFFQVVNHGISAELTQQMRAIGNEFFHLPAEEKLYSDDPAKKVRLSTSFNVKKETVHNWRDYLRLHRHPLEEYLAVCPSKPLAFRDVVSKYRTEVRRLGFFLLGFISLSLGMKQGYIKEVLGEQVQHMAINYYPPCPEPVLTYGLPSHTDPNALTILLQDPQAAVSPHPNAFVINIGDQLQVLSNGKYRSVWHRAVVNSEKESLSVASFLCPCNSSVIAPAKQLTAEDSPAIYRSFTYDEYYKKFWERNLDQEHCLELFRT